MPSRSAVTALVEPKRMRSPRAGLDLSIASCATRARASPKACNCVSLTTKWMDKFYKGNCIYLQGLEGEILMKAIQNLIEQNIPSLPIHDAIYVQSRHQRQAKKTLHKTWQKVLDIKFPNPL
jgi:hypothetical protein